MDNTDRKQIAQLRNVRKLQDLQRAYYLNKLREDPDYRAWDENEASWMVNLLRENEKTIAGLRQKLQKDVPVVAARAIQGYLTYPLKLLNFQAQAIQDALRELKTQIRQSKQGLYTDKMHKDKMLDIFYNRKHNPDRKPLPSIMLDHYHNRKQGTQAQFGWRFIDWRTRQVNNELVKVVRHFNENKFVERDATRMINYHDTKLTWLNREFALVEHFYNLYSQNKAEWPECDFTAFERLSVALQDYRDRYSAYLYVVRDLNAFCQNYEALFDGTATIQQSDWALFEQEWQRIQSELDAKLYAREYSESLTIWQNVQRKRGSDWLNKVDGQASLNTTTNTEATN